MHRRLAQYIVCTTIAAVAVAMTASGSVFRKAPYPILSDSAGEMQIQWQLTGTYSSVIEWGVDETYSVGRLTTSEMGDEHIHHVALTGLAPSVRYSYRVTASNGSRAGSFRTPPAASSQAELVFYGIADSQMAPVDARHFKALCRQLRSEIDAFPSRQTFCLVAGDWVTMASWGWDLPYNVYMRTPVIEMQRQCWDRFFTDAAPVLSTLPLMGCLGNHDLETYIRLEGARELFQTLWPYSFAGRQYGAFDYGPVHVVVVDQYSPFGPGTSQLAWFESDLRAASSRPWTIVVFHEPSPAEWSSSGMLQHLLPLAKQYGVDLVVSGHWHCDAFFEVAVSGADPTAAGTLPQLVMGWSSFPTGATVLARDPSIMQRFSGCPALYYRFRVTAQRMIIEAVTETGAIQFVHTVEQ
jgi:hypothetical protein